MPKVERGNCAMDIAETTIEALSESRLTVTPSTPAIGAEVSGVDLREPLTPDLRDEFRRLLLRHRVLFLRGQQIDTEDHIAFAKNFGRIMIFPTVLDAHPVHPGVHLVRPRRRATGWHVDASGLFAPPVANVLRAINIPPVGGDTIWANGVAVYEGLPDELKETLKGLHVTHDLTQHFHERGIEHPLISHRLVRTHPHTGEKHLFINLAVSPSVIGISPEASEKLIAKLTEEYTRPEYQVRFRWSPGAIAVWDNRVVQHYAVRDYGDFPRHLERILLADFNQPQIEQLI